MKHSATSREFDDSDGVQRINLIGFPDYKQAHSQVCFHPVMFHSQSCNDVDSEAPCNGTKKVYEVIGGGKLSGPNSVLMSKTQIRLNPPNSAHLSVSRKSQNNLTGIRDEKYF